MREVKRIQKLADEVGLLEAEVRARTSLLNRKRKELEKRMVKKGLAFLMWRDANGRKCGIVKFKEERSYWIRNYKALVEFVQMEEAAASFLEFILRSHPKGPKFFSRLIRRCGFRVKDFLVQEHIGRIKVTVTDGMLKKMGNAVAKEWEDRIKREMTNPKYVVVDFHKAKTGEVRPWYR